MTTINLGFTPGEEFRAIDVGEGAPTFGAPIAVTVDMAEVAEKGVVVRALRAMADFLVQNPWPLAGNPIAVEVVDFSAYPSAVEFATGATVQATAPTVTSDGTVVTTGVTWESDDELVATVSAGGLITAIGAGTCTVTATKGSDSDTIAVTVTA